MPLSLGESTFLRGAKDDDSKTECPRFIAKKESDNMQEGAGAFRLSYL
jgi:hypothetical protein